MADLFEAGVIVRAHAGETGDLLAAQPRNPADADTGGQGRFVRAQAGPAGAEEVGQFSVLLQFSSVRRWWGRRLAQLNPGSAGSSTFAHST